MCRIKNKDKDMNKYLVKPRCFNLQFSNMKCLILSKLMSQKMFTSFLILLIIFRNQCQSKSTDEITQDQCAHFNGTLPFTSLTECPPANFMEKDDYECYDESFKEAYFHSKVICVSEYLLFAQQAVWVLKIKVFGQKSTVVK